MAPANQKDFIDKAEALLSSIRSGILVHLQEGVLSRHLRGPLDSARALNSCASKIGDETVFVASDALEAWLTLLATESEHISHTRIRSLLDQISEVEVALLACRANFNPPAMDVGDFVDESFESLRGTRTPVTFVEADATEFEADREMLDVFREEAASLLHNIETNLDALHTQPESKEALWEIKRNAHTFKGAAGVVGLKKTSELAHRVEDLLDQFSDKDARANSDILALLRAASEYLRSLANGEDSAKLDSDIESLYERFADAQKTISHVDAEPQPVIAAAPTLQNEPAPAKPSRNSSIVRVSLDRLDLLVRNIRDLVTCRAMFEQYLSEFHRQLEESNYNAMRLQAASTKIGRIDVFRTGEDAEATALQRKVEFYQTAYELTETAKDVTLIESGFQSIRQQLESLVDSQETLISEIQVRLLRLRNVEFGTIAQRLQRTVRVTCDEEGKTAELTIHNASFEIDTQIIDALIEPLMHLLKNAVVHGIEPAETRRLLGKPEAGRIDLRIGREQNHVLLEIADDGRGIAFQTLVEKAVVSGLLRREDAVTMNTAQTRELMFMPGLTTAETLNLNAGRGVGMSIIRESVEAAGGSISFDTWPQRGTAFYLRVPMPFAEMKSEEPETAVDEPSAPTDGLSVMVVDDSPSVRLMMSRMLQKQGWVVHTANNGIEAFEKLVTMTAPPSVILSDIEMPKMGGFEFIGALRDQETFKDIPVIFISSRSGDANREHGLAAGATHYLTKPYEESKLIGLIEDVASTRELVG